MEMAGGAPTLSWSAWDIQKKESSKNELETGPKLEILATRRMGISLLLLGSKRQWLFLLFHTFFYQPCPAGIGEWSTTFLGTPTLLAIWILSSCATHLHHWGPSRGASKQVEEKKKSHKKSESFWQVLQPSVADARLPDNHQNSWIPSEAYLSQTEPRALLRFVLLWFEWASDGRCVLESKCSLLCWEQQPAEWGACTPVPYRPGSCVCFCLILCSGFCADTKK